MLRQGKDQAIERKNHHPVRRLARVCFGCDLKYNLNTNLKRKEDLYLMKNFKHELKPIYVLYNPQHCIFTYLRPTRGCPSTWPLVLVHAQWLFEYVVEFLGAKETDRDKANRRCAPQPGTLLVR